jgi:hypothetical protein
MNKTSIRAYLSLFGAKSDIDKSKSSLILFFKEKKINEYLFLETRVDSGLNLFVSKDVESYFVEEVLEKLFDKISTNLDLPFLKSKFPFIDYRIEVVISIYNNESPSIFLNNKTIKFLNSNNLEIEFDIYQYSGNL